MIYIGNSADERLHRTNALRKLCCVRQATIIKIDRAKAKEPGP
jgi:hypothetical protein